MLTKEDILLRAIEPEDLELLYSWENDTTNWQISNTLAPYSKFALKQLVSNAGKSIYETRQLRLMIDIVPSSKTIGAIDIFNFDTFNMRAEIGLLIADTSFRQKGYGLKSLICVTDYCFQTLLIHQLHCTILSNNQASIALFKKAGFQERGILPHWVRSGERFLDAHLFSLIYPSCQQ